MEIDSSPLQLNESEVDVSVKQVSRNNSRGVRVVGSRIYDSENGKSCHQCRQKTMDFSAACKNPKNGKPCTIRFCHKCLLNRYGEKAEEVDLLSDWMCPKCKGSCNCSICMKRKGQKPTGLLVHTAKKSGFNSVSEMLSKKSSHDLEKGLVVELFGEPGKENSLDENKGLKVEKEKTKKMKQKKVKEISNGNNVNDASQNKILKKSKHRKGVSENAVKRIENAEIDTKVEEFVVDLFGEPEKENSLGRNKVENEKTKKMKRRKLKEISNGNNVDGACQKKMSKKLKHCNGVPEDDVQRNENAEMETKIEEHLVDLSGETKQKNSLGENKGLKVENVKSKKMKQKKLNEVSDSNNVEEACQKKIRKKPKHCHGVLDVEVKRNENAEMETKAEELVVGLSGEAQQKNSFGENKGLVVEDVKTKKMKQKKLSELANGNNVEGASQKKILKEHCNGVSDGEVKRNENAEMETKVEVNHGVNHVQTDGPVVMLEGDNASAKSKKYPIFFKSQKVKEEVPLPLGTEMTKMLDIEFALEDIGNALQFLEFCRVFGKALDIKKGEAGAILRTLIRKRNLRCGQNALVVEFQIKLLTLIASELDIESSSLTASNGKHSWLNVLKDLIAESKLGLKAFPLDWLNKGSSGYNDLDLSKKLILLNFICDEALGTKKLRSYIDDQNAILTEEKKAARSKVAEAKEKEKSLKQKLQDEMAKAIIQNGATFSILEYDALLLNIKSEAAKAHNEFLEAKGTFSIGNQSCDAVRIEPVYLDNSGKTFWKFKSCNDEHAFLLQDLKIETVDSAVQVDEKWFAYGDEQKDEANKYISSRRRRFPKLASVSDI